MQNGSLDLVRPTLGLLRLLRIFMRYFVQIFQNLEYNTGRIYRCPPWFTQFAYIYIWQIYICTLACLHIQSNYTLLLLNFRLMCTPSGFVCHEVFFYYYFLLLSVHIIHYLESTWISSFAMYIYFFYFIIMGVIWYNLVCIYVLVVIDIKQFQIIIFLCFI